VHLSVVSAWICSELNSVHIIPSLLKGMWKVTKRDLCLCSDGICFGGYIYEILGYIKKC
jgi:hypothetical protein